MPLSWTTAGRPPLPQVGLMGWNRTLGALEVWNGAAWVAVGGGGGGTPDVATIALGWQDFFPDPDPGLGSPVSPAFDPFGSQYAWQFGPDRGFDGGILAVVPLPSNLDLTRFPVVQVMIDDGGSGTGGANFTVGLGIEDIPCGGGIPTGVRGLYPGMLNLSPTDLVSQTQCLIYTGTLAANPGPWHISVRRYSATGGDTAPGNLNVTGITIQVPTLA